MSLLKRKIKKLKKSTVVLLSLSLMAALGIVVYAASVLFFSSDTQTSDYSKKDIFEFTVNEFFIDSGNFGPGEIKSINPIVTSDASVDSYAVIVVEMPKYGSGGLYTINKSTDWTLAEAWSQGDSWFEAYRYNDTLSAGAATTALGDKITMADMTNAQYGQLDDLNVSMTAYACGTDGDETLDSSWDTIKSYYALGE